MRLHLQLSLTTTWKGTSLIHHFFPATMHLESTPLFLLVLGILCVLCLILPDLAHASFAESHCGHNSLKHTVEPRTSARVLYDSDVHPFMKATRDGSRLVNDETVYKPIRVHFDTSHLDGVLTEETKKFIQINLLQRTADRLAEVLKVIPVRGNLKISPRCKSFWNTAERQCANYEMPLRCGGMVEVPTEHLNSESECSTRPDQCTLTEGGEGIPNADVVVYVTAYQYSACASASTLAFASSCARDDILDRPIAGYINLCPTQLEQMNPNSLSSVQRWEYITIHEVVHVLGISSAQFPFYRDTNGDPRTPRDSFGYPPIKNGMYSASENTIKRFNNSDGTSSVKLVTEEALRIAREHFGCESLNGVALEDAGGVGSSGSHTEARYYLGDFMNAAIPQFPIISVISLAILADSNWYKVNYKNANAMVWGRGMGCDFVEKPCLVKHSSDPPDAPFPEHFCNVPNQMGCTHCLKGKGTCSVYRHSTEISPATFQYYTDSRVGGNRMANYCPFYTVYNQFSQGVSSCIDPESAPESSLNPRGESFSVSSRCVINTLNEGGGSISRRGGCYNVDCSLYPQMVKLSVGSSIVSCTADDKGKTKSVSGFGGTLVCPDVHRICASITPDPCQTMVCPSNSRCLEGACQCLSGWEGKECDITTCYGTRSNLTAQVCSGKGSCLAPDDCCCDAGYIGTECEITACFSVAKNDAKVCSSHGTCTGPNICECDEGWHGDNCDKPVCYGIQSDKDSVCNGRGICSAPDTCDCVNNFYGNKCEQFLCIEGESDNVVECTGTSACSHSKDSKEGKDCVCTAVEGEQTCGRSLSLKGESTSKVLLIDLYLGENPPSNIACRDIFDASSLEKLGSNPECAWKTATVLSVTLGEASMLKDQDVLRVDMTPLESVESYFDVRISFNATDDDAIKNPGSGSEEGSGGSAWYESILFIISVGGVGAALILCLSCVLGVAIYLIVSRYMVLGKSKKKFAGTGNVHREGFDSPVTSPSKVEYTRKTQFTDKGDTYVKETRKTWE